MLRNLNRSVKVLVVGLIGLGLLGLASGLGWKGLGLGGGGGDANVGPASQSHDGGRPVGEILVRIEGRRLLVDGQERSAAQIVALAQEQRALVIVEREQRALVIVERAADARAGPFDLLVQELDRAEIHYRIERDGD